MSDNLACSNRINPFFGLGLIVECVYGLLIATRLLVKNENGIFENLTGVESILAECTDTRYV